MTFNIPSHPKNSVILCFSPTPAWAGLQIFQDKLAPLWSLLWAPEEFLLYLVGQYLFSFFFDLGVCRAVSPPFPPISPRCCSEFSPFLNMFSLRHHMAVGLSHALRWVHCNHLESSRLGSHSPCSSPLPGPGYLHPIHKYKYTSRYTEFF